MEWRIHKIIPVFKASNKSLVKNYRPISLLSCISKVLESLIFNKMTNFVSSKISIFQLGFRKHHSSLNQLLEFTSPGLDLLKRETNLKYYILTTRKHSIASPIMSCCIHYTNLELQVISGTGSKNIYHYVSSRAVAIYQYVVI